MMIIPDDTVIDNGHLLVCVHRNKGVVVGVDFLVCLVREGWRIHPV